MNFRSIRAIYIFEMSRFFRTLLQSFVSPVISTCLYFVVFGAAIGGRIDAGWCYWRIHGAWIDNAQRNDAGGFKCIIWYLFPKVY